MLLPSNDRKPATDVLFLIWSDGIGDTIAATPVLRYFCESLGGRKIDVWTRRPEIFAMNPWVEKIHHGFEPDMNFVTQWHRLNIKQTFIRNNKPESLHHYHSPLVDYCSTHALHAILQAHQKHFEVPYAEEHGKRAMALMDHPEFLPMQTKAAVVLHASDTWKTRRMPGETWEELAEKLVTAGVKVFLIGKDVENRMPLKLASMRGVVNLVNKLELLETIALIDKCHAIVTMDSGSICMVGCVPETRIIGVFTVNPPEFRSPWRKGRWDYKLTVANEMPECIYCGVQLQRIDWNLSNCINSTEPMCCLPTAEKLFDLTLREALAEAEERTHGHQ